jgi:hypothetical protein
MRKIGIFILIMIVLFSFSSCGKKGGISKVYTGDNPIDESIVKALTISQLINNADTYSLNYVSVEGKILTECSSGCWIFIADDDGNQVYVDMLPQNFSIPQAGGHKVRVTGIFENRSANPKITAYKVEFLDL